MASCKRFFRVSLLYFALLFILFVPAVAAGDDGYTVQPGDNLYRIALRHGLTTEELATANGISNPHRLYVGQVLTIPGAGATGTDATVPEGTGTSEADSAPDGEAGLVTPIGQSLARVLAATEAANAAAEALVSRQQALAALATAEHVVAAGETLAQIGRRYGVTVAALVRTNALASPNVIYPGQQLQIPVGGTPAQEESVALPPAGGAKQIVVDKSEQRAYVYQDGELLWTFIISTGMPGSETWEGNFQVRSKIPNAYAYNWGLQMPYWLGFYHTGYLENGFHALPIMSSGAVLWDGYLGTPVSYGCVILSYADAETLYRWAEIGTQVIVQP